MEKDIIIAEQQHNDLFQDACQIIEQAQEYAYRQVNETLIKQHPDIFHAVIGKFEIVPSVTGQSEKVPSATGLFATTDLYAIAS